MLNKPIWREEKLGKYAYIKGRIGWRGLKASEYTEDGPYLVAGHHIAAGQVNWSACDHISTSRYLESREIALEEGDIILTKDGTIGRVAIINNLPGLATINSTMMLIRVRSHLVPQYVYHYLTGDSFQKLVVDKVSGSSIPHIFQRDMVELTIPVPSKPEQNYIAEILDTLDEAIAHTSSIIAKLKQIKAGLLHDLLTRGLDENGKLRNAIAHPEQFKDSPIGKIPKDWEVCSIENKLEKIIDYRGKTPEKTNSGVPIITAKNVRKGFIDTENQEYISEKTYEQWMTRGIPNENDILFTTEAPLGNVALFPNYKVALAQRIITLCVNPDKVCSNYLISLLLFEKSCRRLEQKSTGSTVLGIKQSVFRKVLFPFPPVNEQKLISKVIETHDTRIRTEETYLEKLKLQKKGLMHDLLTGKVRVNQVKNNIAIPTTA